MLEHICLSRQHGMVDTQNCQIAVDLGLELTKTSPTPISLNLLAKAYCEFGISKNEHDCFDDIPFWKAMHLWRRIFAKLPVFSVSKFIMQSFFSIS